MFFVVRFGVLVAKNVEDDDAINDECFGAEETKVAQ